MIKLVEKDGRVVAEDKDVDSSDRRAVENWLRSKELILSGDRIVSVATLPYEHTDFALVLGDDAPKRLIPAVSN